MSEVLEFLKNIDPANDPLAPLNQPEGARAARTIVGQPEPQPKAAATALRIAAERGISAEVLRPIVDEVDQQQKVEKSISQVDASEALRRYIEGSPLHAEVSSDDFEKLGFFEKLAQAPALGWQAAFEERERSRSAIGYELGTTSRATLKKEREEADRANRKVEGLSGAWWLGSMVSNMLGSMAAELGEGGAAGLAAGALAGSVGGPIGAVGGAVFGVALSGAITAAGSTFDDISVREEQLAKAGTPQPVPYAAKVAAATTVGIASAIADRLTLSPIAGNAAKVAIKEMTQEALDRTVKDKVFQSTVRYGRPIAEAAVIGGAAQATLQVITDIASDLAATTGGEFHQTFLNSPERREQIVQNLNQALVVGIAAGSTLALPGLGVDVALDRQRAVLSKEARKAHDQLLAARDETETFKRSPEAFEAFAGPALRDKTIEIDADLILESGGMDELISLVPGLDKALARAIDSGGSVTVPYAKYLTKVTPELDKALAPGIRFDPDGLTEREAEFIDAWHGSPHKFEKFDYSKIGTGEGNQTYGYGLYAGEAKGTGEKYQRDVAFSKLKKRFREELSDNADFEEVRELMDSGHFAPEHEKLLRVLDAEDWLGFDYPSQAISAAIKDLENQDPSPELREAVERLGNLYRIKVKAGREELIDFDKPLTEQSSQVQAAIEKIRADNPGAMLLGISKDFTGRDFYQSLAEHFKTSKLSEPDARGVKRTLDEGPAKASEAFRSAGVKGISYLDAGSRGAKGAETTRNIVAFSDDIFEILDVNGEPIARPSEDAQFAPGGKGTVSTPKGQVREELSRAQRFSQKAFHGSRDVITEFDPKKSFVRAGTDKAAIYFAEKPELASRFAEGKSGDDDPMALPDEDPDFLEKIQPYLSTESFKEAKVLFDEYSVLGERYTRERDLPEDVQNRIYELNDKLIEKAREASAFIKYDEEGAKPTGRPNVTPVRIDPGKQLVIDLEGKFTWEAENAALEQARAGGYDTLRMTGGPEGDIIAVFDPARIASEFEFHTPTQAAVQAFGEALDTERADLWLTPLFTEPAAVGMDTARFKRYSRLIEKATELFNTKALAAATREAKRRLTKEWKEKLDSSRAEATEALNERPEVQAYEFFTKNKLFGVEVPKDARIKLDRAAAEKLLVPPDRGTVIEDKGDGGVFIRTKDGTTGILSLSVKDDGVYASISALSASARGQGIGIDLYETAIDYAASKGLPFRSDIAVSPQAANVYDALARRGYSVTKNPEAIGDKKTGWSADTGSYVFEIKKKPGSVLKDMTQAKGGMHPDEMAPYFGLNTGVELVKALQGLQAQLESTTYAKWRREAIEAEAVRRTEEALGALDEKIEREAREAALHRTQQDILNEEIAALGEEIGAPPFQPDDLRLVVGEQFRDTSIHEAAKYHKYARAAGTAGRGAEMALLKASRDVVKAFDYKQKQFKNHLWAMEAQKFRREVERFERRAKKLGKKERRESIAQPFLDQIHSLLLRHGLPVNRDIRRLGRALEGKSLEGFIQKLSDDGLDLEVDRRLFGDSMRDIADKGPGAMTVDEFRGLVTTIKSLEEAGRAVQEVVLGGKREAFNEVRRRLVEQLETLPLHYKEGRKKVVEKALAYVHMGDAFLLQTKQLFEWLDGDKPGGPFGEIYRNIVEAAGYRKDLTARVNERTAAIAKLLPPDANEKVSQRIFTDERLRRGTDEAPFKVMTRMDLIGVALNLGNSGNQERLIHGSWPETKADVKAYIAKRQEVTEAVGALLRKEDLDYIESVWDFFEWLRPDIEAAELRRTGVYPKMVEAHPLELGGRKVKGGYYPIFYDPVVGARAPDEDAIFQQRNYEVNTNRDYLKERAESSTVVEVDGKLLGRQLNISNTGSMLGFRVRQIVNDLAMRDSVEAAWKLLNDPLVRQEINKSIGPEYFERFRPYLQSIANRFVADEGMSNRWAEINAGFRGRVTVALLGLSSSVMLTPSMGDVARNIVRLSKGMGSSPFETLRLILGDKRAWKHADENSPELRHWGKEGYSQELDEFGMVPRKGERITRKMADIAFAVPITMEKYLAHIHWILNYKEGLQKGLSEEDAVWSAEKSLKDSFPRANREDLAPILTAHEAVRTLFPFYSYMSWTYNRTRKAGRKARQGQVAGALMDFISFMAIPAIIGSQFFEFGVEEDDEAAEAALKYVGGSLATLTPITRDIFAYQVQGFKGVQNPIARTLNAVWDSAEAGAELAGGEDFEGKHIQTIASGIGLALGIPIVAPSKAVRFVYDYQEGVQDAESFEQWRRGLTTGKSELR